MGAFGATDATNLPSEAEQRRRIAKRGTERLVALKELIATNPPDKKALVDRVDGINRTIARMAPPPKVKQDELW